MVVIAAAKAVKEKHPFTFVWKWMINELKNVSSRLWTE